MKGSFGFKKERAPYMPGGSVKMVDPSLGG